MIDKSRRARGSRVIDRSNPTYIGRDEIFDFPGDYRVVSIYVMPMYGPYPTVVGAVIRLAEGGLKRLWYTWAEGDADRWVTEGED